MLLRRFGLLWTTSNNLHLDACSFHDCELPVYYDEEDGPRYKKRFLNFVHHVLTLHERNPIHCFHLRFECCMRYSVDEDYLQDPGNQKLIKRELRLANEINTWASFAVRREVKVLDLDLLACGARYSSYGPETLYKIPAFVFNCDSIRELRLVRCRVEPRGQILMRSLRTLFLEFVALDWNKIDEILSGFPFLENLTLIQCYNLEKLNFTSTNLNYLKVVVWKYDEKRVEIFDPDIASIDISGSAGQVLDQTSLFSLELPDFGFGYRICWSKDGNHEARKVLTHYGSYSAWPQWELLKIYFPSMLEKHLMLNIDLRMEYLPGIFSMLCSSPCLEMLDIHIRDAYRTFFWSLDPDLNPESYWDKLEEAFKGLPNNLQTVRIYGLVAEPFVLQLVQLLLQNLKGLQKMVITSKRSQYSNERGHLTSDELLELSLKLLSFPRASANAVILFS